MKTGNQSAPQVFENEFIDLIDVAGFIWKARLWLLSGVIFGALGAFYVSQTKKPPVFNSVIPATLEIAGGITFDTSAAKFLELLSRVDVVSAFTASGGTVINGKVPAKIVSGPSGVTLEIGSLSSDPTGESALKVARVFTLVARDLNKKLLDARAGVPAGQAPEGPSDSEKNYAKLSTAHAQEEAPLRVRLFALETKLSQRAGIRPTPGAITQGTSIGDDVLRMLGALEGKMTPSEHAKVIAEYSELVGSIRAVQAKYEQPVRELTAGLSVLSAGLINNVMGEAGLYPVVVVDEAAFRSIVAAGIHERYESKRSLFLALGVILGGMLGLMGYGMKLFIAANQERIRSVFRA